MTKPAKITTYPPAELVFADGHFVGCIYANRATAPVTWRAWRPQQAPGDGTTCATRDAAIAVLTD